MESVGIHNLKDEPTSATTKLYEGIQVGASLANMSNYIHLFYEAHQLAISTSDLSELAELIEETEADEVAMASIRVQVLVAEAKAITKSAPQEEIDDMVGELEALVAEVADYADEYDITAATTGAVLTSGNRGTAPSIKLVFDDEGIIIDVLYTFVDNTTGQDAYANPWKAGYAALMASVIGEDVADVAALEIHTAYPGSSDTSPSRDDFKQEVVDTLGVNIAGATITSHNFISSLIAAAIAADAVVNPAA